jgi:hypothetical protein
MDKLFDLIIKHRDLSPSTIKNYIRALNKLKLDVGGVGVASFMYRWSEILKHIKDAPTKKPYKLNILNCYIVAIDSYIKEGRENSVEGLWEKTSGDIETGLAECRKLQTQLKQELDVFKFSETKSPSEDKNWVGFEDLEKCVKSNFKSLKNILKRTGLCDHKDIHKIHLWVISALYASGKANPPLRLDFNNMHIIKQDAYNFLEDKTSKNYLVIQSQRTKYFVLNQYKTSKKYGQKTIILSPPLNKVINKYLKIRNEIPNITDQNDLLLFNNKTEPLSEALLSGYIGEAFIHTGKKINANLIRHIFITEVALHLPLAERNVIASKMCHNLEQQLIYNKTNATNSSDEE